MNIKRLILSCVVLLLLGWSIISCNQATQNNSVTDNVEITKNETVMKIELVKLPYAANALEPVISEQTIEFHHGKHLQGYVNNLNNLIQETKFASADLETIVKESDGAIFNNAGQILNHNIYFTQFSPTGGGKPSGRLANAIDAAWGSFENFQKNLKLQAPVYSVRDGFGWLPTKTVN